MQQRTTNQPSHHSGIEKCSLSSQIPLTGLSEVRKEVLLIIDEDITTSFTYSILNHLTGILSKEDWGFMIYNGDTSSEEKVQKKRFKIKFLLC